MKFNGTTATVSNWGAGSITAAVPTGATSGPVVVTVNGVASGGITFTVPPVLQSISVSPQNSSLATGLKAHFTATGTYSDNSTQDLTATATWSSLNTSIAKSNGFGMVTAQSAGNTTITATYGSINGSSTLTVTPPSLVSIGISPSNPYIPQGNAQQLVATGNYSDGSTQDLTSTASWTTSDPTIATISTSGLITTVGAGTASIMAAANGLTFSTNITVTTGMPTITAAASPSPNTAGWNNSNVTVTFTCVPGSYTITNCPGAEVVSTEGTNQVILGTVTDSNNQSASASVTLNIDKTPPTLVVNDPADQQIFTISSITADGTVSDSLSGLASLACNGASITPAPSYSCNLTLNPGLNLVAVQAVDAAGNIALAKLHVNLNAFSVPSSLQITPANISVVVGSVQQFTVIDNQGRPRPDATWTISNQSVATITSSASPLLTGVSVGTATLTATAQGVNAQTQVNVLATTLSPGQTVWAAPTPFRITAHSFLQAASTSGGPDLFDLEADNNWSSPVYRAFTLDGQQLWEQQLGAQGNPYPAAIGDGLGGLFVQVWGSQGNTPVLLDLDAQTGATVWQQSFISSSGLVLGGFRNFSIRPDTSMVIQGSVPNSTDSIPDSAVALFSPAGQRTPVPIQTMKYSVAGGCEPPPSGTSLGYFSMGGIATDGAGNTYFEYSHVESWAITCTSNLPFPDVDVWTSSLRLVTVGANGSVSDQVITSTTESGTSGFGADQIENPIAPGAVIPDGEGGVLATWAQRPAWTSNATAPLEVTHISSNGTTTYELPLPVSMMSMGFPSEGLIADQLVLGDNNTAFALSGGTLASFNLNTGVVNWGYGGAGQILGANGAGEVTIYNAQGAIQLDANGNPSAPVAALLGTTPISMSGWLGILSGDLTMMWSPSGSNGILNTLAASEFPSAGGNAQRQNQPPKCAPTRLNCVLAPEGDSGIVTPRDVTYGVFSLGNGILNDVFNQEPTYGAFEITLSEQTTAQNTDHNHLICKPGSPHCSNIESNDDYKNGIFVDSLIETVNGVTLSVLQQFYIERMPAAVIYWPQLQSGSYTWYGASSQTANITTLTARITQSSPLSQGVACGDRPFTNSVACDPTGP